VLRISKRPEPVENCLPTLVRLARTIKLQSETLSYPKAPRGVTSGAWSGSKHRQLARQVEGVSLIQASSMAVTFQCKIALRPVSAFRPRGVPGPTSKLSPRAPAQMGRRETEHEGGRNRQRGNPRPPCCPVPRSGALAVGGYKRPRGRVRERETVRQPVLPRGQPSRMRALDLPFIGVRRGPRCTMGV
jgi:hypothetical protein